MWARAKGDAGHGQGFSGLSRLGEWGWGLDARAVRIRASLCFFSLVRVAHCLARIVRGGVRVGFEVR